MFQASAVKQFVLVFKYWAGTTCVKQHVTAFIFQLWVSSCVVSILCASLVGCQVARGGLSMNNLRETACNCVSKAWNSDINWDLLMFVIFHTLGCQVVGSLQQVASCFTLCSWLLYWCLQVMQQLACGSSGWHLWTWLILPVVICLSQRLSHACLSISFYTAKLRMAH